ncbi:tyrosine-type recombinase/integrase [Roseiconus lacunae]|uniref:Tyrosine-type recombinase/integrase n=1 Tax=Roseiconus lacunae TaxID=2605694 RepID=A0ABT7PEL7_9BACT|nr:tyrosine-type recombinase/integrase [Roseiconus lacunae]MDM4014928.1 tyrosine-type recombinase/integrase [Roseiconus lacunae]
MVRSTRTTSKKSAEKIASRWEADAALRRAGVIDMTAERISQQSRRPIADHVSEFRASIESPGNSEKHVDDTMKIIDCVIDRESFAALSDVTIESLERYAKYLRDDFGRAPRTIQKHLAAWKQFTKWATDTRRLSTDPLSTLRTPNPEIDRRIERRALHPDEWPLLQAAALVAPDHACGITGPQRALLYELAIQTGLRQNEIRQLTRGKLHLQQSPPFVLLPSRSTKNKSPARQYVSTDLAERIVSYAKQRPAGEPLFVLPHESTVAKMIRKDLALARETWIDEVKGKQRKQRVQSDFLANANSEGQQFDFHALRHTCGAWLALAGENPKTIQTIMRHSSITLTMDTYGHLFPATESDAIRRLADRHFPSKKGSA